MHGLLEEHSIPDAIKAAIRQILEPDEDDEDDRLPFKTQVAWDANRPTPLSDRRVTNVEQNGTVMSMPTATIGFRPNDEDMRILAESGESATDTIRRASPLLDHDRWLDRFREDAERLRDEDVNLEPEAW